MNGASEAPRDNRVRHACFSIWLSPTESGLAQPTPLLRSDARKRGDNPTVID